ncbi:hypothetical protein KP001_09000 [Geomonas subterranea]|uniref:Uncharacterized protein n=2 Tax=Geomonas subterranea TaxID=2847989 RepID=A0ABX8LPL1_9BACT|nr:hypothetical protein [Geomonas subterranea]QXE92635.1 hypothetical protein KP001_09000 [Geomonas subterranea]
MTFETEMIVPLRVLDDPGQEATASITSLRYSLALGYRTDNNHKTGGLELLREELTHAKGEPVKHLLFPHTALTWRNSAARKKKRR